MTITLFVMLFMLFAMKVTSDYMENACARGVRQAAGIE